MTIRMNKEDSVALESSINVWESRVNGEEINEGRENCPLCTLATRRSSGGRESCDGCIIQRHTGVNMCLGTPYAESRSDRGRKQRELNFLKSLRQYNPIAKGDIVNNTDGSYHLRLTDDGLSNQGNISWDNDGEKFEYVVCETDLALPASGSMTGTKTNDTIIRDLATGQYIFTQERFLKLAEEKPEICSECGTEL